MKKLLIGAALVAAQLAAPAMADTGQKRRDIGVAVSDLDLGTREGVAALDRRLARAVAKACGTAHYLEAEQLDDLDRCRADARERATAARNEILRRGSQGGAPGSGASR
jgi:UrcA family protein